MLVGVNKYVKPKTTKIFKSIGYSFVKKEKRKTLIEPIIQKRLSEQIEKQQLKTEN